MDRVPIDVETLLAHEGFVRGLARRLVRDDDEADDVVQQTWVAALARPPRADERGLRGWFTTVVRNVVRQRRRGDARRARRERAAARPEGAPSTAELLARESARRTLVEAVLALEEPTRSTVVLRWLEGLPPREVAERLHVPVETVRTRLKRAIARLRATLDRRHGDDREAWLAALAPLALPGAPPPPRSTRLAPVASAAAGIALVAGGAVWLAREDASPPVPPTTETARVAPREPEPGRDPTLAAAGPAPRAGESSEVLGVRGTVIAPGRRPEAGAHVVLSRTAPDSDAIAETTTDARGRFVFEGVSAGAYRIAAVGADGARGRAVTAATRDDEWVPVFLASDAASMRTVWVRVVDSEGRAVSDVDVYAQRNRWSVSGLRTDAAGTVRFRLPAKRAADDTGPWPLAYVGGASGVARASLSDVTDGGLVTLVLEAPGSISGTLEPAPEGKGTRIAARAAPPDAAAPVLPALEADARGGAFEFERVPPGRYALTVTTPDGRIVDGGRDGTHVFVDVPAGTRTRVALRTIEGASAVGRILGPDGSGLGPAQVLWTREDDRGGPDVGDPARRRALAADEAGNYEVRGLEPGAWRVLVITPRGWVDDRRDLFLAPGVARSIDHRPQPGGDVAVLAEPAARLGLRSPGADAVWKTFVTDEDGFATVHAVPAGRMEVVTLEGARTRLTLGTVDVSSTRAAFLDARRGSRVALTGRVTRNGAPVEGALVTGLGSTDAVTGTDGGYAFREPLAARVVLHSVVTPPEPDGVALRFETGCMSVGKVEIRRDFELPTGAVTLEVAGLDGRPAAGVLATLTAEGAREPGLEGGRAERRTDASGTVRWVGLPAGDYAAVVRFSSGVAARRAFAVADGGAARSKAAEPAGAPLRVRVVDAKGRPAAGTTVSVRSVGVADDPGASDPARFARAVEVPSSTTDAEGVVTVPAVADGVGLVGAVRGVERAAPVVVTVGPHGASTVELRLRPEDR